MGNSSFNPLSIITQNTLKAICENEDTKNIIVDVMNETLIIGKTKYQNAVNYREKIEGAKNVETINFNTTRL